MEKGEERNQSSLTLAFSHETWPLHPTQHWNPGAGEVTKAACSVQGKWKGTSIHRKIRRSQTGAVHLSCHLQPRKPAAVTEHQYPLGQGEGLAGPTRNLGKQL